MTSYCLGHWTLPTDRKHVSDKQITKQTGYAVKFRKIVSFCFCRRFGEKPVLFTRGNDCSQILLTMCID